MHFPEDCIENLRALGYTGDEARFLYLVATHSGYFSTRQYLTFTSSRSGEKSMAFTQKVQGKGHGTARLLLRNGRVYHLCSRLVYRAIGRENLRNRREHSVEHIRTKLAILDFVLGHLDYRYLETESEKVDHFCKKLCLSRAILPAKRYAGAVRQKPTDRYFVDKFPLFFATEPSSSSVVTFSFVDPGMMSVGAFETHLLAYASLFAALPAVQLVYIATRPTQFESARRLFLAMTVRPSKTDPGAEVLRYFALRKFWDAKQYGVLTTQDIEFLNMAQNRFDDALTHIRYHQWAQNSISSEMVRQEFRDLAPKAEVRFNTELVDGQAALFELRVPNRNREIAQPKVTNGLQATFGPDFRAPFGGETQQAEEK